MSMRPLLLMLIMVSTGLAEEKIASVDAKAKIITTEQNGILKLYRLGDQAQITLNGAPSNVEQLLPGQTVTIKSTDTITATKVAAAGLGQPTAPAKPLLLRTVTVQMRVDGSDRIYYQDGKLWIEHLEAKQPSDLVINGVAWVPVWSDNKSDSFTKFSLPVAPIGQGHVSLKALAGRSKIKLEHSTEAAALVSIQDSDGGAGNYAFQLSW